MKFGGGSKYIHYLPVLALPLVLVGWPLLNGEALFWGLPATQFVPWRVLAIEQWIGGEWPLWNPLNGMGAPLLANYQLAFFYPPGWLLNLVFVLGGAPWMAWSMLLLNALHLCWAGLGMMAFLRGLGIQRFGQVIGGLAFAMCGYFVARMGTASMIWAGAWLPWILLGGSRWVEWARTGQKTSGMFLLVAAVTLQLLAGHAQLSWYSLLLLVAWIIFRAWDLRRTKRFIWLAAGVCASLMAAVGVAAVQLFPTAEYLLQSQRSGAVDFDLGLTYSFWPWRLLSFLSPDFFGNPGQGSYFGYASYWEDAVYLGLIPLILALKTLAVILRRRRGTPAVIPQQRNIAFLWAVIGVGMILALGKNLPVFPFLYQYIPTFSMFNAPARYLLWVVFGLAVLAGIGAEQWVRPTGKALKRLKRITVGMLAVTLGALATWLILSSVRITFITATALAGVVASAFCILSLRQPGDVNRQTRWRWAVVAVVGLDLIINTWGLIPTTDKNLYASDDSKLPSTRNGGERLFIGSSDEYSLKFSRFFRFDDFRPIEDWGNIRTVSLPNINILDGIPMVNNFDPLMPGRYTRLMEEMKHISDPEILNWLKWMNVGTVLERDFWTEEGVIERKLEPWGRFRWVGCAEIASGEGDALEMVKNNLKNAKENGPTRVVLEKPTTTNLAECDLTETHSIEVRKIASQTILLSTETTRAGYLVIADVFYPGWEVTIDGSAAELLQADYLFSGLYLSAGKHDIEIQYRPKSFYIGLILSGISFVIVILSVIIVLRSDRLKKP